MLLDEIISLSKWIDSKEAEYQPIEKLNKLLSILRSNTQPVYQHNRNQITTRSFTEEKRNAIDAIKELEISELSQDQIACLEIYDAHNHIGQAAAKRLESLFRDEIHDQVYLGNEVEKAHNSLSLAKKEISETSKKIEPFYKKTHQTKYLKNKSRFSIIFKEGVEIKNLEDLEKSSKEWKNIIYGISRGLGMAANDFEILGARNGSFIIDLYLAVPAIAAFGYILTRSLNIIEQFALSTKRIKSIYDFEINDPAFKEIEKEINASTEKYFSIKQLNSAKSIATDLLSDKENVSEEDKVFLESGIKKILSHLKNGGDLDLFVPDAEIEGIDDKEEQDSAQKANELIKEFRHKKLELLKEDMTALLEHITFEDDEPQI